MARRRSFGGSPDGQTTAERTETAQLRKLDYVCRKLRLRPGERFLDIGSGWGGLIMHAAQHYGVEALGIVDRNSVAGMVRAWEAAKTTGLRLVAGCRLDLVSGESLLVYPQDRAAWSRLTRLLTAGRPQLRVDEKWLGKSECRIRHAGRC